MDVKEVMRYKFIETKLTELGFKLDIRDFFRLKKDGRTYGDFVQMEEVYAFIYGYEWGINENA